MIKRNLTTSQYYDALQQLERCLEKEAKICKMSFNETKNDKYRVKAHMAYWTLDVMKDMGVKE